MMPILSTLVANLSKQASLSILTLLPAAVITLLNLQTPQTGFREIISTSTPPLQVKNTSLNPQSFYSFNQATAAMAAFLGPVSRTAQFEVKTYLLITEVTLADGSYAPLVAEVFVPQQTAHELPLLLYAPGTTGLDDKCAPSREYPSYPRLGNYENQMVSMAAQGFLVVMPNYIGLDDPNRHHLYFDKDTEARSVLGSALGLMAMSPQLPTFSKEIFVGGYSQGGHATFATADLAQELTPGLTIAGIFGHGPTTDTQTLLLRNPNLSPYFAYTYQSLYEDFDINRIFLPDKLFQVDRAPSQCVNQAHAFNSANISNTYTQAFGNSLLLDTVKEEFPEISKRLEAQDAGTSYTTIPTLILQGTGDPIVTLEDQVKFADTLCERNIPVEMKTYTYVHHFQTRQKSFWDTLEWVLQVRNNQYPANYCI